MVKRNKSTSIGGSNRRFLQDNPDKRVVEVYAGEDGVTDKRFIDISPDFEAENSDSYSIGLKGIASSGSKVAGQSFNALRKGSGEVAAVGKMDAGFPAISSYGGRLNIGIRASLLGNVILAATGTQAGDLTDADASAETLSVVSDSASDVGYIYATGVDANGDAISEYIEVEGTTSHTGIVTFTTLYGVVFLNKSSIIRGTPTAAAGSITITNTTSGTTLATITVGLTEKGYKTFTTEKAYGRRIKLTASALTNAPSIIVIGKDIYGDEVTELIAWAASNDVLVKNSLARFDKVYGFMSAAFATTTIAFAVPASNDLENGLQNDVNDVTIDTNTQASATIKVASDEAADVGQIAYVFGYDGTVVAYEAITLNGTTKVESTDLFDVIAGVYLDSAVAGTVTVYLTNGSTVMISFDGATGITSAGMLSLPGGNVGYEPLNLAVGNSLVTITSSNGSAADKLIVDGLDLNGDVQREYLVLSSGTIITVNKYSVIKNIAIVTAAVTEYHAITVAAATNEAYHLGIINDSADALGDEVEVVLE